MGTTRLTGKGAFSEDGSSFAELLSRVGQDSALGDSRFLGRNFLLDEGVVPERRASYEAEAEGGAGSHADLHSWLDRHGEYLARRVFLDQPGSGAPGTVNPSHPACPETFRYPEAFTFASAKTDLDLLRVVNLLPIAKLAREEDKVFAWAEEVVDTKDRESPAWQELARVLGQWSTRCDLRPVYATFWEDQRDLFEGGRPDWADALRDRLGLVHYSPSDRGEIPILVFRYRVSEVPRHRLLPEGRPLAAPIVLDGELSEAFCPAPRGQECGMVVDLSGSFDVPRREVVHPFFPFQVEHLFRVGKVRSSVPRSLVEARRNHLFAVQAHCSRSDYALGTDGDLLT